MTARLLRATLHRDLPGMFALLLQEDLADLFRPGLRREMGTAAGA
jgi:hypothetical protein